MRTSRSWPTACAGFTLVELTMVVAIVGILAGLAVPGYRGYLDKARIARCIAEIRYIEKSVKAFYFSSEVYPNTLAEVGAGGIVDPWGTPYQYLNISGGGPGNSGGGGGQGGGGNNTWEWLLPSSVYAAPPPEAGGGGNQGGNTGGGQTGGGNQGGGTQGGTGGGQTGGGNQGGNGGGQTQPRKDRMLVPINSDFDLYSMGKDGRTVAPLTAPMSHDDIVRANDGAFVGLASEF